LVFADVVLGSNDKLKLFQESDFVVSVLPGTPETENYCSETEFSSMKDSGIFISVGRGSVVDEEALYNALNNNEIAGAALDVFKVEPLPEDSKLWDLNEKILLSSHNADFTQDYFELGWSVFEKNLNAFIESNGNCNDTTMITPVDKENGY
jgi:D-2-hydroxyacid dehydrogenase (NADP+)